MCCHTEIEVVDQTVHLTQSQYTDTGPTSPSADPIRPGAWQGLLSWKIPYINSTSKYLTRLFWWRLFIQLFSNIPFKKHTRHQVCKTVGRGGDGGLEWVGGGGALIELLLQPGSRLFFYHIFLLCTHNDSYIHFYCTLSEQILQLVCISPILPVTSQETRERSPELFTSGAHTLQMEGFQPEWCISTIYHAWDTPFWSGTLEIHHANSNRSQLILFTHEMKALFRT